MYEYRSAYAAQVDVQRLRAPVARPPESIIAYLRGLRRMLTPKETAKILARHPETIYRMIAAGLPAAKHGRSWRIDPICLATWLEKQ
jgi:excisionase family DNA binding protein